MLQQLDERSLFQVPGSGSNIQRDTTNATGRLSPRLRHGIILAVILLVLFVTLASLSPLSNGQIRLPVFSSIGNWVQAQQLSWKIQAHENASQQGSGLNNTVLPPMTLAKSQYVAIAQQDASAVGIPPAYFVRQIQQESGFNPNAVSPAGAVGIAQFEPGTAAGLGINPWDPIQALKGAATLMANYARQYGGDYAKALAAYNGGSGTVQSAVNNCGGELVELFARRDASLHLYYYGDLSAIDARIRGKVTMMSLSLGIFCLTLTLVPT